MEQNVEDEGDDGKRPFQHMSSSSPPPPPPKRHSPRLLRNVAPVNGSHGTNGHQQPSSPLPRTGSTGSIPLAVFPRHAPHLEESYIVSVMVCVNDDDDDDNDNHHHSNRSNSSAHYRWSIHEGKTYLPLKIWRTKVFTMSEIEQYEQSNQNDDNKDVKTSHPELLVQYFPEEVLQLLLTGTDEDDITNKNKVKTCYQNSSNDAADTTPSHTKKQKQQRKSRMNSDVSFFVPKPWNPMLIQQLTSYDLYQYRSHYFHIPMLSIYCIFPVTTDSNREICDLAERGLLCMFHNVLPCRMYRIHHRMNNKCHPPPTTDLASDEEHHHHLTQSIHGNHHAERPPIWNFNEMAIQSILDCEKKTPTTTTSAAAQVHSESQRPQPKHHHFLLLNGGCRKTTFTSYAVEVDVDKDATIESRLQCQYTSFVQQFMNLHESTGTLPLIKKDDIKDVLRRGPPNNKPLTKLPFFVTDSTKAAMIGMVLRNYVLALHQTIKTWVYNIWDDVYAATVTTSESKSNDNVSTSGGAATTTAAKSCESQQLADVVVPCCISGSEYEMILQLLQCSQQDLSDCLDLDSDPDMTWTSPNKRRINLSFSAPSTMPSYFYHSMVLGLPEQYITVRRRKCSTTSTEDDQIPRSDDNVRHHEVHATSIACVSDDGVGQTLMEKKESMLYEYITVVLYKQKNVFLYGLQHVLHRYSRIRNQALLLYDDTYRNDKTESQEQSKDAVTSSKPTVEYLRQRLYGCRIAKYFGNDIYIGYVKSIECDVNDDKDSGSVDEQNRSLSSDLFAIQYDDGDEEDLNLSELYEQLELYLDVMKDYDADEKVHRRTIEERISDAQYLHAQLNGLLFPVTSKVAELESGSKVTELEVGSNVTEFEVGSNMTELETINDNSHTNTESCSLPATVDGQNTIVLEEGHSTGNHNEGNSRTGSRMDENCDVDHAVDVADEPINIQEIVDEGIDHVVQTLHARSQSEELSKPGEG